MPHIRNVAVLIPYTTAQGKVLIFLQKRTSDAKNFPDHFGFFGGGMEEGETPEQAMKREVKKELNINIENYSFWRTYTFERQILHVFLVEVHSGFETQVNVLEGAYGKFLDRDTIANEKATEWDRKICLDFIDSKTV